MLFRSAAARQEQTALRKGEKNFLSVSDLLWLFVIGAFLGDMVETVFCRVTAGVWMSRSSLVWGPFSVVWGLSLIHIFADGGGAGPDRFGGAGAAVCGPAPDAGAAQPETGKAVGYAAPQDRALH